MSKKAKVALLERDPEPADDQRGVAPGRVLEPDDPIFAAYAADYHPEVLVITPFPDPPIDQAIHGMIGAHKVGLLPPMDYTLAPGELFTEMDPASTTTNPRLWVGVWPRNDNYGDVRLMLDNAPAEAQDNSISFTSAIDAGGFRITATGNVPTNRQIEVAVYRYPNPADPIPKGPFGRHLRAFALATPGSGTWTITIQMSGPGVYNVVARQRHRPAGTLTLLSTVTLR